MADKKKRKKFEPMAGVSNWQPKMSDEAYKKAFVGPEKEVLGPKRPELPPYSGDVNAEADNQTRQVPISTIPEIGLITHILKEWMNVPQRRKGPDTVWAWGDPETQYNYQGLFRPSTPNKVGIQAYAYEGAKRNDPASIGALTNELTHAYQYTDLQRRPETDKNPPPPEERARLRATGEIDDSTKYATLPNFARELESSLMDRYMRMYMEVLNAERKQPPGTRPR